MLSNRSIFDYLFGYFFDSVNLLVIFVIILFSICFRIGRCLVILFIFFFESVNCLVIPRYFFSNRLSFKISFCYLFETVIFLVNFWLFVWSFFESVILWLISGLIISKRTNFNQFVWLFFWTDHFSGQFLGSLFEYVNFFCQLLINCLVIFSNLSIFDISFGRFIESVNFWSCVWSIFRIGHFFGQVFC